MAEEIKKGGFDFYLRFAKPLVINLPDPTDRVLAAAWIQKLRNNRSGNEALRTNYLKLLLFVLQRKRLIGPFRENPNTLKDLDEFPEDIQIIDIAKSLLQADESDRKDRLRGLIASGGGDFPPYNIECSADLLEYAAAQDIPKFGVHAYYAISSAPITSWDNVDINFLPKGLNLDGGAEVGEKNIATAASIPDVLNKSHLSMTDSRSKSQSKAAKYERKSPKRSPTKAVFPAKSPLGSEAPVEDRSPPSWGSNLIRVTDPPEDTSFNLSLASGINKADFELLTAEPSGMDISSSQAMPRQGPSSRREQSQTSKGQFLGKFNSISILPGTEKSQDIIDEVNRSLLKSGKELSLAEAEAEIDARFPHRRQDMPRTPPKFSKYRTIRQAGQGIQYSPQQFELSDEESFRYGPSALEEELYTPRRSPTTRKDIRQQRMFEAMLDDVEGEELAFDADDMPDFLKDDILEEVEEAIRTPKNVRKKLKELFSEIESMNESTPALGGVPVTTPKKYPSPGRKALASDFNIEDELALYKETCPDFEEFDNLLDISPEEAMDFSPKSPMHQIVESPRVRTPRLLPESSPSPEVPSYNELMYRTSIAKKATRKQKMRMYPKSSGKEIKVYTRPMKHYRPPRQLNKIEESPEYRRTEEERYMDLYEKLMAEDLPADFPISPAYSPQLSPTLVLSPFASPEAPIHEYFKKIRPEDNQDYLESPDLYESPKAPLELLEIPEKGMDLTEDIFEDVQFKFDFEPIDFGATVKMQNLYDENVDVTPPYSSPPKPSQDKTLTPVTPRKSPVRPKTPSPVRPSPVPPPSPPFYEVENLLNPQELQAAIQAHEFTDRYYSSDPDRRLASVIKSPIAGHRIPLPRKAPRPNLGTIADKPLLEEIMMTRDRLNPPTPPTPLPAGLPWRRQPLPGQVRVEDMPEEVQEKFSQPVPQREMKEWENFVFESVIKPEDKDYFATLFNEYNLINEELIHPDIIEHRGLAEPRWYQPPQDIEIDENFYPKPEIIVEPRAELQAAQIADQSQRLKRNLQMEQDAAFFEGLAGWTDDGEDIFNISATNEMDFSFESPRPCAAGICTRSPPSPEVPTYEELIANAKSAKKKKRPSKMQLGSSTGRSVKKYHTRPLRHYDPLSYLDPIVESPIVSPEVDWQQVRDYALGLMPASAVDVPTTPQVKYKKRRRGEPRIEGNVGVKPRKLNFSALGQDDTNYFPIDSELDEEQINRFNELVATLPEMPPEALPGDLLGHIYEQEFYQPTNIIDKDIPLKHLQYQRKPLSPKRKDFFLPQSPVSPPMSPPKLQSMYEDVINQEIEIDYPDEIGDEYDMSPDSQPVKAKTPRGFNPAAFAMQPVSPSSLLPALESRTRKRFKQRATSPSSPLGLDTLFQSPQDYNLFDRYPEDSHELWMEYEPVDYFEAGGHTPDKNKMWMQPKSKSPPKLKTPPRPRRVPSPDIESPLPKFMSPSEYERMQVFTRSPSPFLQEYYANTPPQPKYRYVLSPTRPSPYRMSDTPPGMPPAFEALEASPNQFPDVESLVYLPSPEYENLDLNEGRVEDFDFSFASSVSSQYGGSPDRMTATPSLSPEQGSPSIHQSFSPRPSPEPLLDDMANWDLDLMANRLIQGSDDFDESLQMLDTSVESNFFDSPVCSPERPCDSPQRESPVSPPRPLVQANQFASPTTDEFKRIIESHEFTDRHLSRDPHRELATKMLRSTKGSKPFQLQRFAPKPQLPTIFDFDESPERINISEVEVAEMPQDLFWKSPEVLEAAPINPARYDTGGYDLSPPRDYKKDLQKQFGHYYEAKRNLFDEFEDDFGLEDADISDVTPPDNVVDAFLHSTPPKLTRPVFVSTPPHAFSPKYPEMYTPPSFSRQSPGTYTPPIRSSPMDSRYEEPMQNITESSTYVENEFSTPAPEYYNRMDQYLTPPSGLRYPRRTYTPQRTPTASPFLPYPGTYTPPSPPSGKRRTYTPSPMQSPPSPHRWFSPSYTPPPVTRWSPPSPPERANIPLGASTARRPLFRESPRLSPRTPGAPCQQGLPCSSPELSFHTPGKNRSRQSEFATPEESPSRVFMLEQEVVYNIENAFAGNQEANILDTSDIQTQDDANNTNFEWMG